MVIYAYDEVAYSSYKKMFGELPNVRILSNILYAADDKSKVHPITGKYDFKTIIEQHKEIRNLIPLTFDHVK